MASLMEKLFLKAVVAEFRRSGLEEATFEDVSWLRHFHIVVVFVLVKYMVTAQGSHLSNGAASLAYPRYCIYH